MAFEHLRDVLGCLGVERSILDTGSREVGEAGGPVLARAKVEEEPAVGGGVGEEEGEGGAGGKMGQGVGDRGASKELEADREEGGGVDDGDGEGNSARGMAKMCLGFDDGLEGIDEAMAYGVEVVMIAAGF